MLVCCVRAANATKNLAHFVLTCAPWSWPVKRMARIFDVTAPLMQCVYEHLGVSRAEAR